MTLINKFIKLMKSELNGKKKKITWIIDENKYLSSKEVKKLKVFCKKSKAQGLQNKKFSQIRNWFMVELGLNAGLRVQEMTTLKHSDPLIDTSKSSIIVLGKGNKKRAVWINSIFKSMCQEYIQYKKKFDFVTNNESFLLNNLKGEKISKRALQKSFKNIFKKAKLGTHYSIHCLRHTYTTFLLIASKHDYRFAQQQLGHASIKTTQVYAGVVESEGKKALEKMYK